MPNTVASILPAPPPTPAALAVFEVHINLANCRYALVVAQRVLSSAATSDPLARELALDLIAATLERTGGAP